MRERKISIIQLRKRQEPEILFGIKLPIIAMNLYKEIKNSKIAYEVFRETFNIKENRLINIVEVRDKNDNLGLVLVIYNNFVTEKERLRLDLEIESFNFNIFELDYNHKIDIEEIVIRVKNLY